MPPSNTVPANTVPSDTGTPRHKEGFVTALTMAPFRWTQQTYGSLSGTGFNIVATLMSVYCAALSVESVRVATASYIGDKQLTQEQIRFVPKPFVDDGARLGRLSPLPNLQRFAVDNIPFVPQWIKGTVRNDSWTIWNEPGLLILAVVAALVIQRFEAMVLRRKGAQVAKRRFEEANKIKKVTADKEAIALARVRASQYNSYGSLELLIKTVGVVGVYGLELFAFISSFAGGAGAGAVMIYGFLTIFGYEVFDYLGADAEKDAA